MRMFKLDPIEHRTSIGDGTEVIHVNLDYILLITEGHPGWGGCITLVGGSTYFIESGAFQRLMQATEPK
jgi:hypothetical protein